MPEVQFDKLISAGLFRQAQYIAIHRIVSLAEAGQG